jgi:antirestriction protein ArdC
MKYNSLMMIKDWKITSFFKIKVFYPILNHTLMNVHDFYEKVTYQVIEMLEQGQVPWQQTWLDGSP